MQESEIFVATYRDWNLASTRTSSSARSAVSHAFNSVEFDSVRPATTASFGTLEFVSWVVCFGAYRNTLLVLLLLFTGNEGSGATTAVAIPSSCCWTSEKGCRSRCILCKKKEEENAFVVR